MGKGKILLLGQDEVNLAMTEMILSEFDYEVSTATDGEEAVRLLTESRHDLLLIDVIMQPMNGIEILERIREIPGLRDINTIFLTASSPHMDLSEALRLGVLFFIPKPVLPESLFAAVRQAMQKTAGHQGRNTFPVHSKTSLPARKLFRSGISITETN